MEDAVLWGSCLCGAVRYELTPEPAMGAQLSLLPVPQGDRNRPQAHIFVGSIAPWEEITDELPQFPEGLNG